MTKYAEITENECLSVRDPVVKGNDLNYTVR